MSTPKSESTVPSQNFVTVLIFVVLEMPEPSQSRAWQGFCCLFSSSPGHLCWVWFVRADWLLHEHI